MLECEELPAFGDDIIEAVVEDEDDDGLVFLGPGPGLGPGPEELAGVTPPSLERERDESETWTLCAAQGCVFVFDLGPSDCIARPGPTTSAHA